MLNYFVNTININDIVVFTHKHNFNNMRSELRSELLTINPKEVDSPKHSKPVKDSSAISHPSADQVTEFEKKLLEWRDRELKAFPGNSENISNAKKRIQSCYALQNTTLALARYNLSSIPCEIGYLVNLEELDLSYNFLSFIPDEISSLVNLKKLNLAVNKISQLTISESGLPKLEQLNLSTNSLIEAPKGIDNLVNLEVLNLEENFIKKLNIDDFKKLTNLKMLIIKKNHLTENPRDHLTSHDLEIDDSKNLYSRRSFICFLIDEADFSEEEIGLDYKLLFKQQDCQIEESNLKLSENLKEDLKSRLDNLFLYFTTDTSSNPMDKNPMDNFIKAMQFFFKEKVKLKSTENMDDYKNFNRSLLIIFSQIFDKREDKLLLENIDSFCANYISKNIDSIKDTSLIDDLIGLIKGEDPLKSCHSEASRQDSDPSVFVNQGLVMRGSLSHPDHTHQGGYSLFGVLSSSQASSFIDDLSDSSQEDNASIKENKHLNHQRSSHHTLYSTRRAQNQAHANNLQPIILANNSVEIPSKSPWFSSCWKCLIAMVSRSRNTN